MQAAELFYLPNVPGTESTYQPLLEELSGRRRLFETVLQSLSQGCSDSISIISEPDGTYQNVLIALEKRKQVQGYIVISTKTLQKAYGKFEGLNEKTFTYSDKPGYVPDHDWFKKRAERLKINWNHGLDSYVMPVSALPEMILSYAYSSGGMVLVNRDLVEDQTTNKAHDVLRITFTFLGLKDERGFHEQYLLPVKHLNASLKRKETSKSTSEQPQNSL